MLQFSFVLVLSEFRSLLLLFKSLFLVCCTLLLFILEFSLEANTTSLFHSFLPFFLSYVLSPFMPFVTLLQLSIASFDHLLMASCNPFQYSLSWCDSNFSSLLIVRNYHMLAFLVKLSHLCIFWCWSHLFTISFKPLFITLASYYKKM